jgi:ribulose-5-phosphate 4-epimerase/fuculose-1-phosphate aldolase
MFTNDLRHARVDLAAVLRWSARLGYQTGTCNHFSFMAPGREDLFLVNPEGYFWSEVTASGLILCDLDGKVIEGEGTVETTAFSLHAPIHRLKPNARALFSYAHAQRHGAVPDQGRPPAARRAGSHDVP